MKTFKFILGWLIPIAIAIALSLVIKTYLFQLVRVDGLSMYPNLQNNEWVMLFKQSKIKHDSVIVFDADGVDPSAKKDAKYVKRVIAMPGDTVEYKDNGDLYINGKFSSQSYISKEQQKKGTLTLELPATSQFTLGSGHKFTVPKDEYLVLGDNRANSNDSRYYGFVPKKKILGVVKVFFWNSKRQIINSYDAN
jgi:signal peptidase I